ERRADGASRAAAVHQEAVVDPRDRLDRVDVRDHAEGGLRLAVADQRLRQEARERVRSRRMPDGLGGLREDVVREAVAGMNEGPVAHRVERLQWNAQHAEQRRPALHAGELRGDADPHHALAHHAGVGADQVRRGIETAAHVQPFDDDRAVEPARRSRPLDEDARLVRCGVAGGDRPPAVAVQGRGAREGRRRAGDEVLLLHVADFRQVERGARDEGRAVPSRHRAFDRRARLLRRHLRGSLVPADVTIIVLNWNGREWTLECLESLRQATLDGATVMVVDNGSTDGSIEAVRGCFPDVRVVALPENRGYAGGNNAGIRAALETGAKAVLLLNNDTRVAPDFLSHLVGVLNRYRRAAAVSSAIMRLDVPEVL